MLVGRWCLGEVGTVRHTVVFTEAMATARNRAGTSGECLVI